MIDSTSLPHRAPNRLARFQVLAVILSLLAASFAASAQEVATQISSQQTRVGEPVQLTVTVTGGRPAKMPPSISVKGLQINLAGQRSSSSMQLGNGGFQMNTTTTYIYLVVPQFEGEFTIPAFEVSVDGRAFRTQPTRLSVSGGSSAPPPQAIPSNPGQLPQTRGQDAIGRPYFAELVISKKKAYVGEVIPAELRFYFNSRIGGQLGDRPAFGGEGFTVQKFSNASKREQVIDGETYSVFTFQTSITPAKAGTLDIPPAKLEARLQLPGSAPQGLPDIFGQMLPPGMFTDTREVTVETRSAKIEVSPLPKEGRPDDFSGAIGRFTLDASVSPKKTEPGDPVTLAATISGQGNFEAMGAPVLTDDQDWRSYPPSEKISKADSAGYTAEKSFEFALIARKDQTQTPGLRFSYFDPSTSKYETIVQPPLPVDARAGTSTASTPQTAAEAPTPSPTPTPAGTPDIAVMAGGSSSWLSILQRRDFWIVNAAIAITWFALITVLSIRRFTKSSAGALAARRREARSLLSHLRSVDPKSFDGDAIRFLCAQLDSDPLSLPSRISSLGLPPDVEATLHAILERDAESRYAAGAGVPPDSTQRADALAALSKISSRHGK